MSTDTVSIGCRLPNGYVLEVGFQTTAQGSNGVPFVMYRKHDDYKAVTLKGTNQGMILRDPAGKPLVTLANTREKPAFINHGVPKDFWDRWTKENPKNWALRTDQLFVVPSARDTAAVSKDAAATSPAIFEPLDGAAPFRVESNLLEKRKDDE